MERFKEKFVNNGYEKLTRIKNPHLLKFIEKYIELCNPDKVFVNTGSKEDENYIRKRALEEGEEKRLKIRGHTIHFDGYYDQARDKENTKFLLPSGLNYGRYINWMDREKGLREIHEILKDIMKGKELYICFHTLGPANSKFTLPCVQLTDSALVAHSEFLLYRYAYEEFLNRGDDPDFLKFIHSAGELDENKTSKNISKRRVYIDLETETVYSTNTQYGGNAIGLKKLALRLAIKRAEREGWLAEHMLILGIPGPGGRITYLTGAFPSMCGKTSTAMIEGGKLVGDDIAFLRKINGRVHAVNSEKGMFGIIQGINSKDDPLIYKAITSENEVIFSNVLMLEDGTVYWIGKDGPVPERGINHSGEWYKGKKDEKGNEIPPSHPNARFTISLYAFENLDREALENPDGVPVGGFIYGGRDSDTWVPVEEAFDWIHGVITKAASLESETTAATLGTVGIRKFNLMSNLDFLSITIGRYIQMYLDFGKDMDNPPKIFSVNYFLKDKKGNFLNERQDKKVWLHWMERRINGEASALKTPTGLIPIYDDLKTLFKEILNKEYTRDDYEEQFKLRIPEHLAKIERIEKIYREISDTPEILFKVLNEQKERLLNLRRIKGDYVSPFEFEKIGEVTHI